MFKFNGRIDSEYLRGRIKAEGYKITEVANIIGVGESTFYKWLADDQMPSIAKIQMLQFVLGGVRLQ